MSVLAPAWTADDGARRARDLLASTLGPEPADGVWAAPGRVNLIGEHTDYNGGLCLPVALPHRTYVAVRRRDDRTVRLSSAQEEGVRTVDLDGVGPAGSPGAVEGWPAYVVGVAWALVAEGLVPAERVTGFDVAVDSCVPYGAGLSSSAALECAVAIALDELWGLGLAADDAGRARLAAACVRAENEVAGAPTGGMDQSASLRAQEARALLLDCRDGSTRQVPFALEAAGLELLVIDTRAPHALVDGQYAERRDSCERAARQLGVTTLREVEDLDAALAALDDPVVQRRVRHVVTEIGRVARFAEELDAGPLDTGRAAALGALMAGSHASMRDDYEISCAELDLAVETATAAGAHGARMTGGGFGGSAIALLPAGQAERVAGAVSAAFAAAGFAAPAFLLAPASAPAARTA
ncbi:galactokinase [Oceanitalea stevensii]|uniref:Galactokinase n=1 Tax=Oceanitalea stevensii TaxID=2763072 RepID=A0ABR8YZM1_9MICO|nr:galactokinase [Oceanitalea stevensii]MBD8061503.1 galactokinase [Oceanitalea stevensii]